MSIVRPLALPSWATCLEHIGRITFRSSCYRYKFSMSGRKESNDTRKARQRLCQRKRYQEILNDPELLALEKEKRQQKYKKKKEEGKLKMIDELPRHSQSELRKIWKENSKRYRLRKKGKLKKEPTFDSAVIEEKEEPINPSVAPTKQTVDLLRKVTRQMKNSENKEKEDMQEEQMECRACLQKFSKGDLLDLFCAWPVPWQGMKNTVAEDFTEITRVQILEDDSCSKSICEICCNKLRDSCIFVCLVQECNQILQQRYRQNSQLEDDDSVWPKPIQVIKSLTEFGDLPEIKIKDEVVSDEETTFDINSMQCDYRDPEIGIADIKIEPEEIVLPEINPAFINGGAQMHDFLNENDTQCMPIVNGSDNTMEDSLTVKEEPLSEDEDESISDLSLECMLCMRAYKSISGLKAHVIAEHSYKSVRRKLSGTPSPVNNTNRQYVCTICRRSFTTSTDLMVHETCHNKSVCYGCNESFDTFAELTKHRKRCKAIPIDIQRPRTLEDVLRPPVIEERQQGKEHRCSLCNEHFSDEFYLNVHLEIHNTDSVVSSKKKKSNAVYSLNTDSDNLLKTIS